MAGRGGQTGRKAACRAALALRKPGTTKATRSVAASAFSRAPGGLTSQRAVRMLRRSGFTAVTRSVAASAPAKSARQT